jgi:hypothetical protein
LIGPSPPGEVGLDDMAKQEFLRQLQSATGYLEFGSGGSTLAVAKFGVRALSIEGDPVYARLVHEALLDARNVEVLRVDIGLTREWSRPVFTWRTRERLAKWRKYVEVPFSRLAELGWFPDFVFVDGRFRRACVLETARQAAILGCPVNIMVDDYFSPGREHYHDVQRWFGQPKRVGRAAMFEWVPNASRSLPSREDLEAAAEDYR